MTALRVFPFIGAVVAIAAVVLGIIGISTTYWFAGDLNNHAGKNRKDFNIRQRFFFDDQVFGKLVLLVFVYELKVDDQQL
jgi:hypothetical protein